MSSDKDSCPPSSDQFASSSADLTDQSSFADQFSSTELSSSVDQNQSFSTSADQPSLFDQSSFESSIVNTSNSIDPLNDSLEVEAENVEEVCSIQLLRQHLNSDVWTDISSSPFTELYLCKISSPTGSTQPPVITHYLVVHSDLTWSLSVHNRDVDLKKCTSLRNMPEHLSSDSLNDLLQQLNNLNVCYGQCDPHFISMFKARKGKIFSSSGNVVAFLDSHIQVTIRTVSCQLLSTFKKCPSCTAYRNTLRAMYSGWSKRSSSDFSDVSSHTNDHYLSTPEKIFKMSNLKRKVKSVEKQVRTLKARIEHLTQQEGESIDSALQDDLLSVMEENNRSIMDAYPENSFARVFWEQQLQAASVKDKRQVRWHPLIIKW